MHDRPTQRELLEIIAETLTDVVVPATAPHAQHQARVAANLCRILAREQGQTEHVTGADSPMARLEQMLDIENGAGDIDTVNDALAATDAATAARVHDAVAELVRQKLVVAKPGHDAHDAAAEANVVA